MEKYNHSKIDYTTKILKDKWGSEKNAPSNYSKYIDSSHRKLIPLKVKEPSESILFIKSITPNNSILQTKFSLPKSGRNILKKGFRFNNLIDKSPCNADTLKLRYSKNNSL